MSVLSAILAWLAAGQPYPHWQWLALSAWALLSAYLKRQPPERVRANEPLELLANALERVPLVGWALRAWQTPGPRASTPRAPRSPSRRAS